MTPHAQISDTPPALVSEETSNKGRVAPAPYVPDKKWKVVLRFNTSNTAQLDDLDPQDRTYEQYDHARDWMEKSGMNMLRGVARRVPAL
jgi:hypothetical protein